MGEVDEGAEKGGMEGGDGVCSESKGVERGKRLEEVSWQALYGVVGEVKVVEALRGGEEVLGDRGDASTLDPQNFQTCENIIFKKSLSGPTDSQFNVCHKNITCTALQQAFRQLSDIG